MRLIDDSVAQSRELATPIIANALDAGGLSGVVS